MRRLNSMNTSPAADASWRRLLAPSPRLIIPFLSMNTAEGVMSPALSLFLMISGVTPLRTATALELDEYITCSGCILEAALGALAAPNNTLFVYEYGGGSDVSGPLIVFDDFGCHPVENSDGA